MWFSRKLMMITWNGDERNDEVLKKMIAKRKFTSNEKGLLGKYDTLRTN